MLYGRPEDCGGAYAYASMKDLLENDPDSEEAEGFRDWLGIEKGETWESLHPVDLDQINEDLREL